MEARPLPFPLIPAFSLGEKEQAAGGFGASNDFLPAPIADNMWFLAVFSRFQGFYGAK
jgi:hypothetical protein